jgi:hypothetical protein
VRGPAPVQRNVAIMTTGMRTALRLAALSVLCLGIVACGGSGGGKSSNREQIQQMFASMESAMAKGDYTGACQSLSEREQGEVVSGAKQAGLSASDCAGAFSALIKTAGVSKAQLAKAFGGGEAPKIKSLSVHGDQATVTYTATDNGKPFTETDALVKQNGSWKADRTIRRSGG